MVRRAILLATTLILLVAALPVAAADGCPASASGFRPGPVNGTWVRGDPIPSGDLLWEVTIVQGAAAEGLSVEQVAAALGLGSVEDFYAYAVEGWRYLDKNGDGFICFKPFPDHQKGLAAYFSNFVDSNAKASK